MKIFWGWLLLLVMPCVVAADLTAAAGVIGLLEVPQLSCAHQGQPSRNRPLVLFEKPTAAAPIAEIRAVSDTRVDTGLCEAGATRLYRTTAGGESAAQILPTLEWGYEEPGLIVVARRGPWFQVIIPGGLAWLRLQSQQMVFRSVPTLLQGAYAYSTQGPTTLRLHQHAGGTGRFVDTPVKQSAPLVVQAAKHVNRQIWLKVGLLPEAAEGMADRDVGCSDPLESRFFLAEGWLAFHDQDRQPRVWFYSRGC